MQLTNMSIALYGDSLFYDGRSYSTLLRVTHSFTHSLTHQHTHSLTNTLTHSLTTHSHPLTHILLYTNIYNVTYIRRRIIIIPYNAATIIRDAHTRIKQHQTRCDDQPRHLTHRAGKRLSGS